MFVASNSQQSSGPAAAVQLGQMLECANMQPGCLYHTAGPHSCAQAAQYATCTTAALPFYSAMLYHGLEAACCIGLLDVLGWQSSVFPTVECCGWLIHRWS